MTSSNDFPEFEPSSDGSSSFFVSDFAPLEDARRKRLVRDTWLCGRTGSHIDYGFCVEPRMWIGHEYSLSPSLQEQSFGFVGQTAAARHFQQFMSFDPFWAGYDIVDVIGIGSAWDCGPEHEWKCYEHLLVTSNHHGDTYFYIEIIDSSHNSVIETPRLVSHLPALTRPPPRDMGPLHEFLESVYLGVTYQSKGPEFLPELRSALTSLFSVPESWAKTLNPELRPVAETSIAALKKSGTTPLQAFRWFVDNWRSLKEAPLFTHMTNLLSIAIATGFAPEHWSELHLNSIKIFRLSAVSKYTDAMTMFDAIISATSYFVEAAVASWDQGNLMPFLYQHGVAAELDKSFEEISAIMPSVQSGEFLQAGGDWSGLMLKLENAINSYSVAVSTAPGGSLQRKIFHDRQMKLTSWRFDLTVMQRGGDVIEQAFACILHGKSRCGKTGVTLDLQKILAAIEGVEYTPAQTAKVLPDDSFHSQVYYYTKFLVFDDVANRKLKYDKSLGIATLLAAVNNSPFVAVKAELELKGKVMPMLTGVFGNTNYRPLYIDQISNAPESMRKRFYLVDMEVLPTWADTEGGIDKTMVKKYRPDKVRYGGAEYDDIHLFTISESGSGGFVPVVRQDKTLVDLHMHEFLHWMEFLMREHREQQKEYVARTNSRSFKKCSACGHVGCRCRTRPLPTVDEDDDESTTSWLEHARPETPPSDWMPQQVEDQDAILPEYQSAYVDVLKKTVRAAVQQGIVERLGDSIILRPIVMTLLPSHFFAKELTKFLIGYLNATPYTQWWFWIPEYAWEWDFFKKFSTVVQDVQLRRIILRWQLYAWLTFWGSIVSALVGYLWDPWYWYVLLALLPSWFYAGCKCCSLRYQAHRLLSLRRNDVMSQFSAESRERWSKTTKLLFESLQLAITFAVFWKGWCFVSELLTPATPDTTSIEKKVEGLRSEVLKEAKEAGDKAVKSPPKPLTVEQVLTAKDTAGEKIVADVPKVLQSLIPTDEQALKVRDQTKNVWEQMVAKVHLDYVNPGQTFDQLHKLGLNNLSLVEKVVADEQHGCRWQAVCNILWIDTDFFICTAHDTPKTLEKWRISDNSAHSSSLVRVVGIEDFKIFGEIAIGHVPYRSKKNIINKLNANPGQLTAMFVHKNLDTYEELNHHVHGRLYCDPSTQLNAILWKWPDGHDTFAGACGGIYISTSNQPAIIGIHYACDRSDHSVGLSAIPTKDQISEAYAHFMGMPHTCVSAMEPTSWVPVINGKAAYTPGERKVGDVVDQAEWLNRNDPTPPEPEEMIPIDTHIAPGPVVKPLTPAEAADGIPDPSIDPDYQGVQVKGQVSTMAFYKSRAVATMIADSVRDKFKINKDFGKPRFGRSMWPKGLRYAMVSTCGIPTRDLMWAVQDWMAPFQKLPEYLLKYLRPLTLHEAVNGISGVRFIDSMNFSTSMGWNFSGNKRCWIQTYLDELSGEEYKVFVKEVWDQVLVAMDKLARGERVPWIFNAVPKDEPTDVNKDKVRLFMVGEIACTLLVRKYFTPVCRVIQMLTGLSECAVGINATGPDWQEVKDHLGRFHLAFDGDHAKYDARKSSKISAASYRMMIEIARQGDYSDFDLYIMQMMVADLLRPLVNFNGTVLLLDGSTPSGIPVTVIINSLDNSLFNRCAYHRIFPKDQPGSFRKYVSHINYGDDFINTVAESRRDFNFLTLQKYLHTYGVKITPGIKEAEGKPFVDSIESLVFLQRSSVKLPELGYSVGALNENSILKSLLCVLKPKSDYRPDLAAVTNCDGALREWVYHGEEIYEDRRARIKEILDEHNLTHLSLVVSKSYHELLSELKLDDYARRSELELE